MKSKLLKLLVMTLKQSLYGVVLQTIFFTAIYAEEIHAQNIESVREVLLDVKLEDANLFYAFQVIERNTSFKFAYDQKDLKDLSKDVRISFSKKRATVADLLMEISKVSNLKFRQVNDLINVNIREKEHKGDVIEVIIKSVTITGKVTSSEEDEGLPGVNILVKGTTQGTVTDVDGNYVLDVPGEESVLILSSVGYVRQEIVVGSRTVIDVSMVPDLTALEEIVVVGYGTQKKVNLTGAVDNVSGEVLADRPASNVSLLLQGVSPNLDISLNRMGGEPGAAQNWQIRGIGSISGNSTPLILVDGAEMDPNLLDPESIESVSVLKDASASAIYGSRAAFGVVLITTKKGKIGQPVQIQYTNNLSLAQPIYIPSMEDSYTYAIAFNQARANAGLGPKFPDEQVERILGHINGTYPHEYDYDNPPTSLWRGRHFGNANVNWTEKYYKPNAFLQKHNINLSGGNDKTQYYFNAGYFDQPGLYSWGDDGYKRYNIIANMKSQVTNWLSFDFGTKYGKTETDNPLGMVGLPRTYTWSQFIDFWPTMPEFNEDGTFNNPLQNLLLYGGRIVTEQDDLWLNLGVEIEPVKGWKTNVKYRYNPRWGSTTKTPKPVPVPIPDGSVGNIGESKSGFESILNQGHYTLFSAYSSYEREIGKHFFKALIGYEQDLSYSRGLTGSKQVLITENVPSISTALGATQLDDWMNHWATQGVFGRINYNYQGKYLIEFSARYDGSSRFEKGSREGFFPSLSAGYNISRENFWSSIEPIVNTLKLRGSYGSLGNQRVSNYSYLATIPIAYRQTTSLFNQGYVVDDATPLYARAPNLITNNLTWETVTTLDFGVDATFLKNRLGLTFDWYDRTTSDMLGPAEILPSVLGTTVPKSNNAELSTKGIELSLTWRDRISNDLSYNARISFGDNQTTIISYTNENGFIDTWYEGKKYGEIWGLTTDKIIQTVGESMPDQSLYYATWGPGDIKFKDLDNNNIIDEGARTLDDHGDLSVIGNSSPRYNYNFSAGIKWKNFDFNMFWQGIGKREIFPNVASEYFWGLSAHPNNSALLEDGLALDYWRPADEINILGPNTDSYFPKPYFSSQSYKNRRPQSKYIVNAAYLRLRNLQVGYTIPKHISKKAFIENARIYFSGENLLTFSKLPKLFEPETFASSERGNGGVDLGEIYPISRMYSFGVNVTF